MIIAINFLAIKYNQQWDFTEAQLYTLSSHSRAIVSALDKPLKVLIFDRNIDPISRRLLENFRQASQQFQYESIDPEQELGLARQYQVRSLGDIYLEYGDKIQKLDVRNVTRGQTLTETQLIDSIEKIKRDRATNIYFLQGHGEAPNQLVERGIAQIINSLENKGNTVADLNLAQRGFIPQDANLIAIVGATRKLLTAEVASLKSYLSAGGNLLILLSPKTDIGIDSLLNNWGVELDNRLIVDASRASENMGFGPGVAIVNSYSNHPITASFGNGISIFPESRPLKLTAKAGIEQTSLAFTNEKTWAEKDLKNSEIVFDINRDLSGPFNVAIALKREKPQVARMVVFGSSTFATNGWFEQQLNGALLVNSVNWLIEEDQKILAIQPREAANRRINLSSLQISILRWLAWRITPLLALIIAILFWYEHR
ncbi:MAG: Gldg family protein [Cyanobacteria bacterium P01_G01_bin.19]